MDIIGAAGMWLSDENAEVTRNTKSMSTWDGCMFSNETMMNPQTWRDYSFNDDRSAERARLESRLLQNSR